MKKQQKKWKSAEEKQKYYELQSSWAKVQAKHATPTISTKNETRKISELSHLTGKGYRRGDVSHIPSISDGIGSTSKKEVPSYTGTSMIGVSQTHKSNLVPVFSTEQAQDIAKMRRG